MFNSFQKPLFDQVSAKAKLVRFGGDCYNYGLLASRNWRLSSAAGDGYGGDYLAAETESVSDPAAFSRRMSALMEAGFKGRS